MPLAHFYYRAKALILFYMDRDTPLKRFASVPDAQGSVGCLPIMVDIGLFWADSFRVRRHPGRNHSDRSKLRDLRRVIIATLLNSNDPEAGVFVPSFWLWTPIRPKAAARRNFRSVTCVNSQKPWHIKL
jgi:hypothetical protein